MTCAEYAKRFRDYIDAPEEETRGPGEDLMRHARNCPACRDLTVGEMLAWYALGGADDPGVGKEVAEALADHVREMLTRTTRN